MNEEVIPDIIKAERSRRGYGGGQGVSELGVSSPFG
jgi:hypothetical protein